MAKLNKQQLIEALATVAHNASLSDLEAMTSKELGALLQSSPKLSTPIMLEKEVVQLGELVEITDESIEHDKEMARQCKDKKDLDSLPLGYSIMKEDENAFYITMPNGKESENTHTTYASALAEAIEDAKANPARVVTKKRGEALRVDKKVSAKDKAYDLFKTNAELKSTELLNLVCLELSMDRKVASSYLCYYRKEYNIVATRGLTKEDKLLAFINDQFSCDLSEGQMKAILSSINED